MNKWLAVTGSCLALFVVGCGGDDKQESGGGSAPPPKEEKGSSGSGGGAAAKVSLKEIQFKPSAISVAKGGTVTWTNDDSVGHDVTKKGGPGADFKSGEPGALQGGDTFKQKFDVAGKIDYVCTVHPTMTGSVTVK